VVISMSAGRVGSSSLAWPRALILPPSTTSRPSSKYS
jgi:hypothetical protein